MSAYTSYQKMKVALFKEIKSSKFKLYVIKRREYTYTSEIKRKMRNSNV